MRITDQTKWGLVKAAAIPDQIEVRISSLLISPIFSVKPRRIRAPSVFRELFMNFICVVRKACTDNNSDKDVLCLVIIQKSLYF